MNHQDRESSFRTARSWTSGSSGKTSTASTSRSSGRRRSSRTSWHWQSRTRTLDLQLNNANQPCFLIVTIENMPEPFVYTVNITYTSQFHNYGVNIGCFHIRHCWTVSAVSSASSSRRLVDNDAPFWASGHLFIPNPKQAEGTSSRSTGRCLMQWHRVVPSRHQSE